jgi:alpha-ketoglutarate-dependent taurine dioxygenase
MRAAYDALDTETANRLEGLRAHHSLYYSQSRVGHHAGAVDDPGVEPDESKGQTYGGYGFHKGPIPIRPLVKTHPVTGRKNLLLGRHAYDVDGMTHEESEAFLDDLMERACQPPRTYAHQWEPGDALLWDNRRLMHRASMWPFDEPRVMWHTRIAGDPETEAALSA